MLLFDGVFMDEFRNWILPICAVATLYILLASKTSEERANIWYFSKSLIKKLFIFFAILLFVSWFFIWGMNSEPLTRWDVLWLVVVASELTFCGSLFITSFIATKHEERFKALEVKIEELSKDKADE